MLKDAAETAKAGPEHSRTKAAPLLGADTDAVYSALLGKSAEDLKTLREQKII